MIKKIRIPIYFGTLVLIQEKTLFHIPEQWKPKDFDVLGYEGLAYFRDDKDGYRFFVMAFEEKAKIKTIAHEAFHTVNGIFYHKGVQYDQKNDEHAAYLLGWIVEQCHKYLQVR